MRYILQFYRSRRGMHVNEGEGGGASMMTRRQKHIMNDETVLWAVLLSWLG